MTEVIMPKMGDGMEEGTLVEWLKKDGDQVSSGDVIGTIQTDKATLELEAPGTGVLQGLLIKAGETVPVGRPIGAILKPGESLPGGWGGSSSAQASSTASQPSSVASEAPDPQAPAPETVTQAIPATSNGADSSTRIKASPLARKIASERGIDLAKILGSGPGGRIVEKDLPSEAPAVTTTPVTGPPASAPVARVEAKAEDSSVPLNRIRQITAKRTLESKQQVPHFYVTVEVDVEAIVALREMFETQQSGKVSVNDFVVKACAAALRDMPEVNASYQGATLLQFGAVNIGMAVALPDGLTVPVIRNADQLSLRQVAAKSKELAAKARDNKLSMDELTGSTFSISNMGMLDVDNFVAIINQPNSAIVAIASIRKKPVVTENDEIVVRHRMNITGSFDHRVVDGAIGAKFINLVRAYLENPTRLLG